METEAFFHRKTKEKSSGESTPEEKASDEKLRYTSLKKGIIGMASFIAVIKSG